MRTGWGSTEQSTRTDARFTPKRQTLLQLFPQDLQCLPRGFLLWSGGIKEKPGPQR